MLKGTYFSINLEFILSFLKIHRSRLLEGKCCIFIICCWGNLSPTLFGSMSLEWSQPSCDIGNVIIRNLPTVYVLAKTLIPWFPPPNFHNSNFFPDFSRKELVSKWQFSFLILSPWEGNLLTHLNDRFSMGFPKVTIVLLVKVCTISQQCHLVLWIMSPNYTQVAVFGFFLQN